MKLTVTLNEEDLRLLEYLTGHDRKQFVDRPKAVERVLKIALSAWADKKSLAALRSAQAANKSALEKRYELFPRLRKSA